ncbi:hypothetical protein L3X38_042421 [Prunus dulcis]|uniref:Uncharacterized protein n=1 Tax=Prunus dulcis TaxID=3755 RepID=A0AAD4UWU4_PRUDU|nr:hypothetical protein L3X38_042421 [Prunus dulcis]
MVASQRRWWWQVAGGRILAVVAGGGIPTVVAGSDGRRQDFGGDGWLDMDMWHSMLALEGVTLSSLPSILDVRGWWEKEGTLFHKNNVHLFHIEQ